MQFTLVLCRRVLLLAFSVLFLSKAVVCSSGDCSPEFKACLERCEEGVCQDPATARLPRSLRMFFWTCRDNCKYTCMHIITTHDQANGREVQQFYGKWPFYRLGGIQEPASVAFS